MAQIIGSHRKKRSSLNAISLIMLVTYLTRKRASRGPSRLRRGPPATVEETIFTFGGAGLGHVRVVYRVVV